MSESWLLIFLMADIFHMVIRLIPRRFLLSQSSLRQCHTDWMRVQDTLTMTSLRKVQHSLDQN
nr:hypothetical protein Iba_chr14bCG3860 [Ipomoea batatas]